MSKKKSVRQETTETTDNDQSALKCRCIKRQRAAALHRMSKSSCFDFEEFHAHNTALC